MAIFDNSRQCLAYVHRYLFMCILVFVKLETKDIEFYCNKRVALLVKHKLY